MTSFREKNVSSDCFKCVLRLRYYIELKIPLHNAKTCGLFMVRVESGQLV